MWEYGLLHFSLLFGFIYSFGFVYGLIMLVGFVIAVDFILDKLGYVRLPFIDLLMCFDSEGYRLTLAGFFEIEKIKFEEFEQMIYERVILHIRKLSQVRENICGIYLWRDIDKEVARKQIKRWTKKLSNEKEVIQYWSEIANGLMPLDKPLWEFFIVEDYTNDTSVVMARFHHSFTDGVGFVSLMSWLNDNKYWIKNTKLIPKPSIIQNILLTLLFPYFLFKMLSNSRNISSDENAAKIRKMNKEDSYVDLFASKTFEFESIRKCYKRFSNTTFNDYLLGVVSKCLHKWFKESGIDNAQKMKILIPINLRSFPSWIEELILDNWLITFSHSLPISDNLEDNIKESKSYLKKYFKIEQFLAVNIAGKIFKNLPNWILKKFIYDEALSGLDLWFSNLPYSSEPMYILSKKQLSLYPFTNMFKGINLMLVALTYQGQLRFTLMGRRGMALDPKRFIKIVEDTITEEISMNSKAN